MASAGEETRNKEKPHLKHGREYASSNDHGKLVGRSKSAAGNENHLEGADEPCSAGHGQLTNRIAAGEGCVRVR